MDRRVVITGMGVVSPLGNDLESLTAALGRAHNAAGPITRFDASTFPTRVAAEVQGFNLSNWLADAERFRKSGPTVHFGLASTKQALDDAGLLGFPGIDPGRIGLYIGAGEGEQDFHKLLSFIAFCHRPEDRSFDGRMFSQLGQKYYDPEVEYEQEIHISTGHIARYFGIGGPISSCLTSCAAGNQAIGEATQNIRRGEADIMVAGGSHSIIHPLGITGFCKLTAMTSRNDDPLHASRPFDLRRDGFLPGEGSGIVILEELEHAKKRGAKIYAEVTGYGLSADAYRVTDGHPEGRNAILCMRDTLADARVNPDEIGYVNAHGTSTMMNDRLETRAIKTVFGEHAKNLPISSTKSMMGHLIAAAGAIESVICVLAIQKNLLPPTINYEVPDPQCDLDYIPNHAREVRVNHVLNNSFGFGGQNVCLIISRF